MAQTAQRIAEGPVDAVLEAMLGEDAAGARLLSSGRESNDLWQVELPDGRTLVIKRAAQYLEDAARRFAAASAASSALLDRAGVLAPRYLDLPADIDERPVTAYWKIMNPTMGGVWQDVTPRARPAALRELGSLMRRIHSVRMPGYGRLGHGDHELDGFESFFSRDLGERLLEPVRHAWPQGAPIVETLADFVPAVAGRVDPDGAVLTHGDMHLHNVLCDAEQDDIGCVGVIDLENAVAHPPESDLALFSVYHGPRLGRPITEPPNWFVRLWEGYARPLDPVVLAFCRAYHLVNLGFHFAVSGNRSHALTLGDDARLEIDALERADRAGDGTPAGLGCNHVC